MPDWNKIVRERIARVNMEGSEESDLAEELAQHLGDMYRELQSGGASETLAYRRTMAELDHLRPLEDEYGQTERKLRNQTLPTGDRLTGNWFVDLSRDLRYAGRSMRKNYLFTVFVILTLALGIGANTTVFTIFNTLILNPLPIPDSSRLGAVAMQQTKNWSKSKAPLPISYADLEDFQAKNEVFSSLTGYTSPRIVTLETSGGPQRMFSELVTGNYFSTLGLTPALGRFFAPDENGAAGAHPVAVLNYATWQARFGGASNVLGKTLALNHVAVTVIGVAPPRFIGVNAVFGPDLWIPLAMADQLLPGEMQGLLGDRSKAVLQGVGRLKPGVTRAQADADIAGIAAALARAYPETDDGRTAGVRPLSDVIFGNSGAGGTPVFLGTVMLLIVVGIVLLIACSNVANLLIARSAARQQEVAVRLAIGASRSRLVRQLLTESVSLGLLSGLAAVTVGYAGLQLLWSALPSDVSANLIRPNMDATVLAFTLAVSVVTGFVFGTIPALEATRTNVVEALKEESRSTGGSRRKVTFANVLLVGQVAFSFLLLAAASLFLRSIVRAYDIDPGFQTRNLAVFLTNPGQAGYGKAQAKAFYKEVRERVEAMPGVQSASWASNLPLWGRVANGVQVEGRQQRSKSDTITTVLNTVDLDYFETAGVAIDQGRAFTEMDRENSTPVAVINEKMAHDYWPTSDPLGHRIQLPGESAARQIVGIARTASYSTLGEPPQPCIYIPLEQNYSDGMTLYVRSKGKPEQIMLAVQREVRAAGPQILVNDIRSGRTIMDAGLFQQKIGVLLLSVFGLLALGLASIGLYGIMAYSVTRRKREVGIRMALGAPQDSVLRLIVKQGMSVVMTGLLIGFGGVLLVGRLLSKMLYGVSASDPLSVGAAALLLVSVALLACYLPARRASRIDPLVALREG